MKVEEIEIAGESVRRYPLSERLGDSNRIFTPPKTVNEIPKKTFSFAELCEEYQHLDLVKMCGQKVPLIKISDISSLEKVLISQSREGSAIPKKFQKYYAKRLELIKKSSATNGQVVGVSDFYSEGDSPCMKLRQTGYYDFLSTNLSQDFLLNAFDDTFEEGATLRDYERKQIDTDPFRLQHSFFANILGVCFVITDKYGELLFAERSTKITRGGGIANVGGTPKWRDAVDANFKFHSLMQRHAEEEMLEELCLVPNEFAIRNCHLDYDLSDYGTILSLVVDTKRSVEEIAKRCRGSKEAKKEGTALYSIPKKESILKAMVQRDTPYAMRNLGSITTLYHGLE